MPFATAKSASEITVKEAFLQEFRAVLQVANSRMYNIIQMNNLTRQGFTEVQSITNSGVVFLQKKMAPDYIM